MWKVEAFHSYIVAYDINENINVKREHLTKFIELVEHFSGTINLYIRLFYKFLVLIKCDDSIIKIMFDTSITQNEYNELIDKLDKITHRLKEIGNFFHNPVTKNMVGYIEILDYRSIKIVFKNSTTYILNIDDINNFKEKVIHKKSILLLNKNNPNNVKIIKTIDKLSKLFNHYFLVIDNMLLIYNNSLDALITVISIDKVEIDDVIKQLTFGLFTSKNLKGVK